MTNDDPFHLNDALEQVAEARARLEAFSYSLESVSKWGQTDDHFSQATNTIHRRLWKDLADKYQFLFMRFIMSRPELDNEMYKMQKTVYQNFLDDRRFHVESVFGTLSAEERDQLVKRLRTRVFRLKELYPTDETTE